MREGPGWQRQAQPPEKRRGQKGQCSAQSCEEAQLAWEVPDVPGVAVLRCAAENVNVGGRIVGVQAGPEGLVHRRKSKVLSCAQWAATEDF